MTWSEVLVHAAQDDRYWDREVRRPAIGFFARGTKRSFSDFETSSPCGACSWGPRRRRGNRAGSGQQVNQHRDIDQNCNDKGGSKGGRGSISQTGTVRHNPGRRPDLLPRCHQLRATHARHVSARTCACVSEMLAASPKQLRGMYSDRSKLTSYPVLVDTGCKCVKQCACDASCGALWRRGWVHTSCCRHVAEISTFSKLVENVRQERVLWLQAAPPHLTFSAERPPRGWACVAVVGFLGDWPPRECACVIVVVSLCVFLEGHRVSQDSSISVKTQVQPMKLGASKRECCLASGKEFTLTTFLGFRLGL